MNNYTIKSQEAVQAAGNLRKKRSASHRNRSSVERRDRKGENITNFIFNKLGVNSRNVLAAFGSNRGWIPESVRRLSYLSD